MRNEQRQRIFLARADVNEVDVQSVDVRLELRIRIESRLRLAPVIGGSPILNELLQPGQLRALRLIGDGFLIRPSCCRESLAQIGDIGIRDVDFERAYCVSLCIQCGCHDDYSSYN